MSTLVRNRQHRALPLLLASALATISCSPAVGGADGRAGVERDARTTSAMVVSANQIASDVGAEVLRNGGNAIDAAIATGFVLAVDLVALSVAVVGSGVQARAHLRLLPLHSLQVRAGDRLQLPLQVVHRAGQRDHLAGGGRLNFGEEPPRRAPGGPSGIPPGSSRSTSSPTTSARSFRTSGARS